MSAITSTSSAYPASLNIDYPDKPLNRLTSFFRIFAVIPIAIILGLLAGASFDWSESAAQGWRMAAAGSGITSLPLVLMILFRKKYPKWWYDWNLALTKFSFRVSSYIFLLRDEYPSTNEEQAVHVDFPYPDTQKLARGLPLVKWFLAIPHYVVLGFLMIAFLFCAFINWWAILFTGRNIKGFFDFMVGFFRWCLRVEAYAFLLITDKYPPFSLEG